MLGISFLFSRISLLGTAHAGSETSKRQIATTNYLSFLFAAITLIGSILSFIDHYYLAAGSYLSFSLFQLFILWLQKKGYGLLARLLLTFLPQLFLLVPLYFSNSVSQLYIDHFHILLAACIIPILLFHDEKEFRWLMIGTLYGLFLILTYDTVFGFNSSPNIKFDALNAEFIRFKFRQLLFYGIIIGGYFVKIKLSQYFEKKLVHANENLTEKNKKINDIIGAIQIQNEEMQSQQEEMRAQNDDLFAKQQEIVDLNLRIEKFTDILMELTKSRHLKKGDLRPILTEVSKIAAQALNIDRVSIWEFGWKRDQIVCQNLYIAQSNSNLQSAEIKVDDNPLYFEVINSGQILVANNAFTHPATAAFGQHYLETNRIYSMLDVPFHFNGEVKGVICCENVDAIKVWSKEEISFVTSIADVVSLGYESAERRKGEERIRVQKEEILSINEELLVQQEKINMINESLEKKVKERTNLLEKKNSQLQEYTYVNSHLLRGPLCRILGIIYLVENNLIEDSSIDFIEHLKESAGELDEMVKKITRNLEKDKPISAADSLVQSQLADN